jgi:predicted ATPase/DNA-binding XRE family transcriptional regulator
MIGQKRALPPTSEVATIALPWWQVLRALRDARGVTQDGWAALLGVSRKTVQRWEAGTTVPDAAAEAAIVALCEEYGLFRTYTRGALAGRPLTVALLRDLLAEARLGAGIVAGESRESDGSGALPAIPAVSPSPRPSQQAGTAPARPGNLPAPLTSFVGRRRELAELNGLLETTRLLTLSGPGGCGKTRLALELAALVQPEYEDGVWLVDLTALADGDLAVAAVAAALDVRERAEQPLLAALTAWLRPRRLLLILDNCEHLVAACARLAATLLKAAPDLRILATSREALGVGGEMVWRVPPLGVPDRPGDDSLQALAAVDAVQLFVERAACARPGFTLGPHNAAAIAELCRRLEGLPLALELAAARVPVLTVAQIVERLDDRFALLTAGNRAAPPRQQTLRATLDWSYGLLSEPVQALFRQLAVFTGPFTLAAAEAIAMLEGTSKTVLDLLSCLVGKSLIVATPCAEGVRYHLLETIREYAWEWLRAGGEQALLQRRHATYYLSQAERAEQALVGPEQAEWFERLDSAHDQLRGALSWAIENGETELGLRLAAALWRFWETRGYLREGRDWLERLLSDERAPVPAAVRAKALFAASVLAMQRGELHRARIWCEESLAIRRALGNRLGIAASLNTLGNITKGLGDYESAALLLEESRAIWQAEGHQRGLSASLFNLALVLRYQGDYLRAQALLQESLTLYRELGNVQGIARALRALAEVYCVRGDLETASRCLTECPPLDRTLNDVLGHAYTLDGLGCVAHARGADDQAVRFHEESLSLFRTLQGWDTALALAHLALAVQGQGDLARAEQLFQESIALSREAGDRGLLVQTLCQLALLRSDQGRVDAATNCLAEALRVLPDPKARPFAAALCNTAAALAATRAALERAPELKRRGLERATELLAATAALCETMGIVLAPADRARSERLERTARATLSAPVYARRWERGWALSPDQALAMATALILPTWPAASANGC